MVATELVPRLKKAAKPSGRVQRTSRRVGVALVIPTVLLLGFAVVYPLVTVGTSAFEKGADDVSWALQGQGNMQSLWRTFTSALIVTLICIVVAYPYAYAMSRAKKPVLILMTIVLLVPFWTSNLVRSFAWVVALDDKGAVNWSLDRVGLGPLNILPSSIAVIVAMSQVMLPFMILPLFSAMKNIDPRLRQAASGLGAKPLVAFLRTDLQLSLPGCFAGAILVFVISLGFYIVPALLGSPEDSLYSVLIAVQVDRLLDFGKASALALILLVSTLAILAVGGLIKKYLVPDQQRNGGGWL